MTLQVDVVSPDRILWSGEANMVIARTVGGGDIAFLTGHTPIVGALAVSVVTIRSDSGDQVVAVHGGFVEVSNDKVTVLSDVAELADHIDVARAEELLAWAEERLRHEHDAEAEGALARAQLRLDVATR